MKFKEFVDVSTAKVLKLLGFNEPCFSYYDSLSGSLSVSIKEETQDSLREGQFLAPTKQLVMWWLRKMGIQINVITLCRTKYKIEYYTEIGDFRNKEPSGEYIKINWIRIPVGTVNFDSYEEAIISGIDVATTMLVGNKVINKT